MYSKWIKSGFILAMLLVSMVSLSMAGCPWFIKNDLYTAQCGVLKEVPASKGILANDPAGTKVLDPASITIDPKYGTIDVAADGSFVYDPSGATGIRSGTYVIFKYGANNGFCDAKYLGIAKIQISCKCMPKDEVCDGRDNNCNGEVDEGDVCCTDEVCDDLDNDCDGEVDEGGVCCTDEVCDDGLDNDCDGNADTDDADCACDGSNSFCGGFTNCADLSCSHGIGIGNACFMTTEGYGKCLADRFCSELADCVTSADCGDGVCIKDSCCVVNKCWPAADFCDDFGAGLTRYSQSAPTGPTGTSSGDK